MANEPNSGKTALGVNENVAGALAYVLGWVSGIVVLIVEKDNQFVRYHAWQSIVVFAALTVISVVVQVIPGIGGFLVWLVGVATFVAWIVLMIQAAQGNRYKVPYAGDIAERQVA